MKSTRYFMMLDNNIGVNSKVSEDMATEITKKKLLVLTTPWLFEVPSPRNPTYICIDLILPTSSLSATFVR